MLIKGSTIKQKFRTNRVIIYKNFSESLQLHVSHGYAGFTKYVRKRNQPLRIGVVNFARFCVKNNYLPNARIIVLKKSHIVSEKYVLEIFFMKVYAFTLNWT